MSSIPVVNSKRISRDNAKGMTKFGQLGQCFPTTQQNKVVVSFAFYRWKAKDTRLQFRQSSIAV